MTRTISDLILEQLAAYGVKYLFGVIGDAIFPLADALARQSRIQFVPATIETSAAFTATYYAKLTDGLGVCIGTSGPGAVNLANGVAEAFLDGAPVLCLSGQVTTDQLGTAVKQDFNQTQFFTAITSCSQLCANAKAVIPILTELINQALTYRTAVHLEIPRDVLAQPAQSQVTIPGPVISNFSGSGLSYGDLDQAYDQISQAQNPLIVIGQSARAWAGAILEWADIFGAGIILTQETKGALPDRHPLVIGGLGEAFLPRCLAKTDIIILFGSTPAETRFFPQSSRVIQFRNDAHSDQNKFYTIRGDFEHFVLTLKAKFTERAPRIQWRQMINEANLERLNTVEQAQPWQHPVNFLRHLSHSVADNALIALDVGEFLYWFNLGFLATNQQVLLSSKWRSMGSGIPAGIAACFGSTDRQIVTLVGDGGFLMSLSELVTIKRLNLPITIFLLRNNLYGLEVQKMTHENFTPFGVDLILPGLKELAESFNINSYRINNSGETVGIIKEALANPPSLVEVPVVSVKLPHL